MHLPRFVTRLVAAVVLIAAASPVTAQSAIADLHGFKPREVKSAAFTTTTTQDVQIDAVGAESGQPWQSFSWIRSMWPANHDEIRRPWTGNAWILDLRTRKVVWELSAANTARGSADTRTFTGTVRLPAGSYAAYYAAFPDNVSVDADGRITTDRSWSLFGRDQMDAFRFVVRGTGRTLAPAEVEALRQAFLPHAVVTLRPGSSERFEQSGFSLDRPTTVDIYAQGEAREDAEFDFGWIINADTRERVWTMTWRDSRNAGGADKNRRETTTRSLPAGRYVAFYATDDSHDPSQWNSPPPSDPDFWGLAVSVPDAAARAAVKTFAYEFVPADATIVALTRIGDSEARRQGFTLNRPMDVRIYALGEGRDGQMFDYGWITGSDGRHRVWEMRYDDTQRAGGDPKNRVIDRTVHLDAGSYVVHYVSDGSHSAAGWNAPAPPDGAHWGITVQSAARPLDKAAVGPYVEAADSSILAQLTEIRDDQHARREFTLARDSDVRIFAVGEGTGGDMDDYGWIEDARTGQRVWEMSYPATERAGGAEKNRRFEGTIRLPAGPYVLHYRTDGSHAFGDWNANPPDEPDMWGVTLYRGR